MNLHPFFRPLADLVQQGGDDSAERLRAQLERMAQDLPDDLGQELAQGVRDLALDWPSLHVEAALKLLFQLLDQASVEAETKEEPAEDAEEGLSLLLLAACMDRLADIQELALRLEHEQTAEDTLEELRRLLHSCKGELQALSMAEAQGLFHAAEGLVDRCTVESREGAIDPLLALCDWLKGYGQFLDQGTQSSPPAWGDLLATLQGALKVSSTERIEFPAEVMADESLPEFLSEVHQHLEDIERDLLDWESQPSTEELIHRVFRAFHTIKGVAGIMQLDPMIELAHVTETLLDRFRRGELECSKAEVDLIFESKDMLSALLGILSGADGPLVDEHGGLIERIQASLGGMPVEAEAGVEVPILDAPPAEVLGQRLVDLGHLTAADLEAAEASLDQWEMMGRKGSLQDVLLELGFVNATQVQAAAEPAEKPEEPAAIEVVPVQAPSKPSPESPARKRPAMASTVKVGTDRLDALVDMVGELVIAQQMLIQDPALTITHSSNLSRSLALVSKITRDLQEASMAMRMVTFQSVFQKIGRLVRDVAAKAGKSVELVIEGAETEVDRNVVEKISDPLVHLVRNAIDHGLETAAEREALGKSSTGRLEIRATQAGGSIVIEVRDDGQGLSRDRILERAIERDLVPAGSNPWDLSDQEIFGMIFLPGFSTAETVTDLSGRGVGMDVVRKNIEGMRGRIETDSTPGEGTLFSLRLPLTLAIIDGMVVRAGSSRYVIPTLAIMQTFRPGQGQVKEALGGERFVDVRGGLVPIRDLEALIHEGGAGRDPERSLDQEASSVHILVGLGEEHCCLRVDEVIGQQQIVIKSLDGVVPETQGIAGGAILGDGCVALIVDVEGLLREALVVAR